MVFPDALAYEIQMMAYIVTVYGGLFFRVGYLLHLFLDLYCCGSKKKIFMFGFIFFVG